MKLFYNDDYIASKHAFETTRKSQLIVESLERFPMQKLEIISPDPVTAQQLSKVHTKQYIRDVQYGGKLASSQGFVWDPGIWKMVCASTGGMVEAAKEALINGHSGTLSSGLHHARKAHGAGFCTFNGIALACVEVANDVENILIIDLDAHCGGGTHELTAKMENVWQLDIATNAYDCYQETERHALHIVDTAQEYIITLRRELKRFSEEGPYFDLVIYNAGVDCYEGCDIGGLPGFNDIAIQIRDSLVYEWCYCLGHPIAFTIAGGYTGPRFSEEELIRFHRGTIAAAARYSSQCGTMRRSTSKSV